MDSVEFCGGTHLGSTGQAEAFAQLVAPLLCEAGAAQHRHPLSIAKGTRLKQSCSWDNTTPQPLLFPTEMCIGFAYYFPGESRIMCEEE